MLNVSKRVVEPATTRVLVVELLVFLLVVDFTTELFEKRAPNIPPKENICAHPSVINFPFPSTGRLNTLPEKAA
jgi:hypothetical protein